MPLRSGANVTLGLNWSRTGPMQTHPGGFTPEENAIYGCSAFSMTFIDSRHEVPSYSMVNASLRYTSDDGRWMAGIYGNNLTDEVYANNAQAFGRGYWTMGGPLGGQGISAPARNAIAEYRGRPREWGVTFQYNFLLRRADPVSRRRARGCGRRPWTAAARDRRDRASARQ
jgi:hypothetical protein